MCSVRLPGACTRWTLDPPPLLTRCPQGEYAARVHNLRSYAAISRDLLARWAFPFVPDTNVFHKAGHWGPSSYRYARGHK